MAVEVVEMAAAVAVAAIVVEGLTPIHQQLKVKFSSSAPNSPRKRTV